MRKIVVVGGSGFVGTRLLELLKAGGFEVVNVDKQPSRFHSDVTVEGNVLNVESLVPHLRGADAVVLLAAEHRDDVSPTSLYYDVNVGGMRNVLAAMEQAGVRRIIFTSSVAVYGLNKPNPAEDFPADPFNHYGKSKWQAEEVLREWWAEHEDWNVNILRPTVIFGERNRGNVYNLLRQISGGRFMMIGKGVNKKSMAYVGNIVELIRYLIENRREGCNVFNYADKPDFDMNQLVSHVGTVLKRDIPTAHIPYALGMLGGYGFDLLAFLTRRKLAISSVRVRKFCATTQFDASKIHAEFAAPYTLGEGLERTLTFEFVAPLTDGVTFVSE